MKKLNYLLLGAAGLVLASCAQEDLVSNTGNGDGTANVSLSLSTPKIGTRAFSDGTTAQKLQYAVYEVKGAEGSETYTLLNKEGYCSDEDEAVTEIQMKKTMNFKLLTDHTYRFVFWAESMDKDNKDTNPYEITFADNKADLAVDYSKLNGGNILCNDENLDAFYGGIDLKITGDVAMDVPLKRPFAQINVGTKDYSDAQKLGYPATGNKLHSTITTKSYGMMSLFDGEITGDPYPVQFSFAEVPSAADGTFPVAGYDYLAMTYILVPDADEVVMDVTFNYKEDGETLDHTRIVGSVPVKRNHRTNIYGQILTSDADLTIHIEPAYDDPDYEPSALEMAAALGGTVELDANVTLPESTRIDVQKDLVVNLNGKNITGASNLDGVFLVRPGVNLTIKGEGTVKVADNDANKGIAVWNYGGTITIEGGNYEAAGDETSLIYCQSGTIYIKGGTFKIDGDPTFTLNCRDADYKSGEAKIIVTGGTFYNYDPSNSASENPEASFVAPGYKVVETDGTNGDKIYTVIPDNVKAVTTMDEAMEAAKNGEDVILVGDIKEMPNTNVYGTNWAAIIQNGGTIDGNGQTLSTTNYTNSSNGKENYGIWTSGGTIKNLTIVNAFRGIYAAEKMTEDLIIDNCVLKSAYTLNTAGSNYDDYTLTVTNSDLYGWTTWAAFKSAEFTNCNFLPSVAWPNTKAYWLARAYVPTVFSNCKFDKDFTISLCPDNDDVVATLNNCTVDGQPLTADNIHFEFMFYKVATEKGQPVLVHYNENATINYVIDGKPYTAKCPGLQEGDGAHSHEWNDFVVE
ncbi:MAG: hypothetical protein J1F43_07965 [Muribaculaceae bacterium]|nr:hypothetical protein [Muribaculaceae bacterium]